VADDPWANVRREVERLHGRPVSNELWAFLEIKYDHLGPESARAEDLAFDLDEIAIRVGERASSEPAAQFVRKSDGTSRVLALSTVLASEAANVDEVRAFRGRALPNGLIKHQDCAAWIRERHEEPSTSDRVLLAYAPPDAQWVYRIAVTRGGVLGELAHLSEVLADMFGWQEQQATMFLLSGVVPLVAPIRVTVRRKGPIAAASRIILEIDPWTEPAAVQATYRRVRKENARGQRYRPLGERALALAAFVAERADLSDEKRRQLWNRAHAEWKYPDVRTFTRAYREATATLLDPKII